MSQTHKQTGNAGEAHARDYLETQGYVILEMNWRCKAGEIDIIAQQDNTIVFIEVKTRRGTLSEAFAQITPAKRRKLIRSTNFYLNEHKLHNRLWRIDAIAIALKQGDEPTIQHVEDALDW